MPTIQNQIGRYGMGLKSNKISKIFLQTEISFLFGLCITKLQTKANNSKPNNNKG